MTLQVSHIHQRTIGPFHLKNMAGTIPARTIYTAQGAFLCDNCARMSVAFGELPNDVHPSNTPEIFGRTALTWHPLKAQTPSFSDVPEHIEQAAKEAHVAFAVGAPMAAILMARTVVEASAKAKGITSGRLVQKIDALAEQDFIRGSTKDAAHEIRHFGNDMAHGDIEAAPSKDDAAEVLALMDEVLNEVFQGPARTARIRARRESPAAEHESQKKADDNTPPQAGIIGRAW
ncbi:DUF4145 domain-containing protein [Microbacterium sp. CGR1]|uniref:DUF4145 domain-containing protein n=1 Tax=Microbacterium sp. CGR1 TaxID=1696072 RepID=UPI003DA2DE60